MYDNKKLTVINFFAGPSVGKSTIAPALYVKMKKKGMKVEFVHEFAKDCVWESMTHIFTEQDYIFGQQHRMIRRLIRHDIDYAVVDSSILLGLLYMPEWFPKSFEPFLLDVFHSYNNINIFLERNPAIPYVQAGRNQTEEQAKHKDVELKTLLHKHAIPYFSFLSEDGVEDKILKYIEMLHTGHR